MAADIELVCGISFHLEFGFELQFDLATDETVFSAAFRTENYSHAKNAFPIGAQAHGQKDANVWIEDASRMFSVDLSARRLCSYWRVGTQCTLCALDQEANEPLPTLALKSVSIRSLSSAGVLNINMYIYSIICIYISIHIYV